MREAVDSEVENLPGTKPLQAHGDLAAQMVSGIDGFLARELESSIVGRGVHWSRDFSSVGRYLQSVKTNRDSLQRIIGAGDRRERVEMQLQATTSQPALVGVAPHYSAFAVRWNVLEGVEGEGLLLQPEGDPVAHVIALPDCDWLPEALVGLMPGAPPRAQFARKLAEDGCRVLVPLLIDRRDTYSGTPYSMTNQPHREFIYRAAYELGRHIIGYEVQKVLGAVDWIIRDAADRKPIGVMGYGEGGLIAFYAAALDTRIDAAAICGYFGPREGIWREPIYRNIWSLLREFGDAEIASLISPRPLIIEACRGPEIGGPPQTQGRHGAAPGSLTTPPYADVEREVRRALQLVKGLVPPARIALVGNGDGTPGSDDALSKFLMGLGVDRKTPSTEEMPKHLRRSFDPQVRSKRQFAQLLEHTQHLMREAEFKRPEFWAKADESSVESWRKSCAWYRDYLWEEVIGSLPHADADPNPRTRLIYDEPKFRGYEVMLDVYAQVYAYGILLVPKGMAPGERRAAVVCQHGLEGRPQDVADPRVDNPAYHRFACKLADRGFIAYAPQNPYIGEDKFRVLQRKANPLQMSLFSFIVRQHEQTLKWLSSLPFVDPSRIGFYGLSYGGKTAMRVPAILEGYCLSICSADYNEWIWKNASARHRYSYLNTGEYEMPEFDLGNTFNYAELSWLICPRPFMVERGHEDGVAPDEWVAYEFARTRRRYDLFDIGDRAEMEVFNGPHTINGVGTFEFLHRHLKWPKPQKDAE